MGFKIELHLDLSDGFDEESLLGEIRLTDGVDLIAEESIYLDSWLDALWAGSMAAHKGFSKSAIEIPEHSQRRRVHRDRPGSVHVAFRDHEVIALAAGEFEQAILGAVAGFTDKVSKLSGKEYELPGLDRS